MVSDDKICNRVPIITNFSQIPKKESFRINTINESKVRSILKQKDF